MKTKQIIKIIIGIIVTIFLIAGVPIIINECYKANYGYVTVWNKEDILGYYGTILGSIIAVSSLAVTIIFTKKQLQRESFLKSEREKWTKLKDVFLQILDKINPMNIFKDVMDVGFSEPTKAINILQNYQLSCKMANDQLIANISTSDEPKFKELIVTIANMAERFVLISQDEINQYTDLRNLRNKESALEIIKIENENPDSFPKKVIEFNKEVIEKTKNKDSDSIHLRLSELEKQLIDMYSTEYRELLSLVGSTFDNINLETQKEADSILLLSTKSTRKVRTHGKEKS